MNAAPYRDLCFGRCQTEELDDLSHDADCVLNLVEQPEYQQRPGQYRQQMEAELLDQDDS